MTPAPPSGPPSSDDREVTLNPRVKLVVRRHEGEVFAVTTTAPARGRPLRTNTILRSHEPEVFGFLARIAEKRGAFEAELDDLSWTRLVEIGVLVPGDVMARRVRFRCSPLNPPADLLPLDARDEARPERARLRVNAGMRYAAGRQPPGESATPSPFADDCTWARVPHAGVPVPSVISAGDAEGDVFRRMSPGAEPPADLDPALEAALIRAGVLVDPAAEDRRRAAWESARAEASERYLRDRYTVVRGLIHPVQLAALRRYYRDLVAEGWVSLGDDQVSLRYRAHNEPLARHLHRELCPLVGAIAGELVKPSYVFFASYTPGAALEPHRDREQCEVSVSLQLDYTPEPRGPTPWPLYVEAPDAPGGAAGVTLGLGDGIVYRGGELTHFRHALPEGHGSTSLFLHYVPIGFEGSLQ